MTRLQVLSGEITELLTLPEGFTGTAYVRFDFNNGLVRQVFRVSQLQRMTVVMQEQVVSLKGGTEKKLADPS